VDVNVHPNKLEVRFQNEIAIAAAVESLVRDAMHGESLGAKLNVQPSENKTEAEKSSFTVVQLPVAEEKESLQAKSIPVLAESVQKATEEKMFPAEPHKPAVERKAEAESIKELKPVVISPPAPAEQTMKQTVVSFQKTAVGHVPVTQVKLVEIRKDIPAVASLVKPVGPKPVIAVNVEKKEVPVETQRMIAPEEPVQTVLTAVEEMEQPLRLAGILFDTYWMFETGDRVLMVDQHAAHERILYDQMMKRFEDERISQKLLAPQLVQLTKYDMSLVGEFAPVLAEAGFEVEPFDESSVALHAIPTFFGVNDSPRELLLEALAEWQAGRGQVTRERLRRRVAQMACKRAIKGGDRLSETEIRGFMQEMLRSDSMPTCPHGRPIVTEITRYALEKRFKRIQ